MKHPPRYTTVSSIIPVPILNAVTWSNAPTSNEEKSLNARTPNPTTPLSILMQNRAMRLITPTSNKAKNHNVRTPNPTKNSA